jgi:hypothetical protein
VGQLGFYDLDKRLEAISAKGDPLVMWWTAPAPGIDVP